jgi:hypothetical protein
VRVLVPLVHAFLVGMVCIVSRVLAFGMISLSCHSLSMESFRRSFTHALTVGKSCLLYTCILLRISDCLTFSPSGGRSRMRAAVPSDLRLLLAAGAVRSLDPSQSCSAADAAMTRVITTQIGSNACQANVG